MPLLEKGIHSAIWRTCLELTAFKCCWDLTSLSYLRQLVHTGEYEHLKNITYARKRGQQIRYIKQRRKQWDKNVFLFLSDRSWGSLPSLSHLPPSSISSICHISTCIICCSWSWNIVFQWILYPKLLSVCSQSCLCAGADFQPCPPHPSFIQLPFASFSKVQKYFISFSMGRNPLNI